MTRQKRVLALLYLTSLMSYPYTAQIPSYSLSETAARVLRKLPGFLRN